MSITKLDPLDCTGCRSCGDVCPLNCITFHLDQERFYHPTVDEALCINCSKCEHICPSITIPKTVAPSNAYAAHCNSSVYRNQGSSGGLFGIIARHIISQGGKVWGARFDENLQLHHYYTETETDLQPLMRSKYLQSDTSGVYKSIMSDLKKGVLTLFTGTPCQCAAIVNMAGKYRENLYVVDIVCHGVPSQDLFNKCMKYIENKNKIRITSFSFRSKQKGAKHPQSYSYTYIKKGKQYLNTGLHYQNPFYFGFQKYITLRPSCYRCKEAKHERVSDITLGDFWDIDKLYPDLDPKSGISMILANTNKGLNLLNEIRNSIYIKEVPVDFAYKCNHNLNEPTKLKPARAEFFKDLASESFDNVVKNFLVPKRKLIFDLYYAIPSPIRKLIRKAMDNKMKYE